jgi:ribosome-associated protein
MADPARDLVVTDDLTIPAAELQWRFSRASGPGGQGVNTTDSRVQLQWDPTRSAALTPAQRDRLRAVFTVSASEHRSQVQNRQAARHRLARRVQSALAPKRTRRRRTLPTAASVTRRKQAKRRRSELKASRRPPPPE